MNKFQTNGIRADKNTFKYKLFAIILSICLVALLIPSGAFAVIANTANENNEVSNVESVDNNEDINTKTTIEDETLDVNNIDDNEYLEKLLVDTQVQESENNLFLEDEESFTSSNQTQSNEGNMVQSAFSWDYIHRNSIVTLVQSGVLTTLLDNETSNWFKQNEISFSYYQIDQNDQRFMYLYDDSLTKIHTLEMRFIGEEGEYIRATHDPRWLVCDLENPKEMNNLVNIFPTDQPVKMEAGKMLVADCLANQRIYINLKGGYIDESKIPAGWTKYQSTKVGTTYYKAINVVDYVTVPIDEWKDNVPEKTLGTSGLKYYFEGYDTSRGPRLWDLELVASIYRQLDTLWSNSTAIWSYTGGVKLGGTTDEHEFDTHIKSIKATVDNNKNLQLTITDKNDQVSTYTSTPQIKDSKNVLTNWCYTSQPSSFSSTEMVVGQEYTFDDSVIFYMDVESVVNAKNGDHGTVTKVNNNDADEDDANEIQTNESTFNVAMGTRVSKINGDQVTLTSNYNHNRGNNKTYTIKATADPTYVVSGWKINDGTSTRDLVEGDTITTTTDLTPVYQVFKTTASASVDSSQSHLGKVDPTSFEITKDDTWKVVGNKIEFTHYQGASAYATFTASPLDEQLSKFTKWTMNGTDLKDGDTGTIALSAVSFQANFELLKSYVSVEMPLESIMTPQQVATILQKGWVKDTSIQDAIVYKKTFEHGTKASDIIEDWDGITPFIEHYDFVKFSPSFSTHVSENDKFTAEFKAIEYDLTWEVESIEGKTPGTISHKGSEVATINDYYMIQASENNVIKIYDENGEEIASYTANNNYGYKFKQWKANGEPIVAETKYYVDKATKFSAEFEKVMFNVTIKFAATGVGTVSDTKTQYSSDFTVKVQQGTTYTIKDDQPQYPYIVEFSDGQKLILQPQTNYYGFWSNADAAVLKDGYTSGKIEADQSISAHFYDPSKHVGIELDKKYYTEGTEGTSDISFGSRTYEGVDVPGNWVETWDGTYTNGTITVDDNSSKPITITATAKTGYAFIGWTVNDKYYEAGKGAIDGTVDTVKFQPHFVKKWNFTMNINDTSLGEISPESTTVVIPDGATYTYNQTTSSLDFAYTYTKFPSWKWSKSIVAKPKQHNLFDGFYLGADKITGQKTATQDTAINVKFNKGWQVTIDLNGGYLKPDQTIPAGWKKVDNTTFTKDYVNGSDISTICGEWATCTPNKTGHDFSEWTPKTGSVTSDTTIKATYTPHSHTIYVNFSKDAGKGTIPDSFTVQKNFGESWSYDIEEVTGYTTTESELKVESMPDKDVTFNVQYVANEWTLTITYECEDGTEIPTYSHVYKYSTDYQVNSPTFENMDCDTPVVSGEMPNQDLTVNVKYTVKKYTVSASADKHDTQKGSVSAGLNNVWYGTTYQVDNQEGTITFTFPESYPGEKVQTISAVAEGDAAFTNWKINDIESQLEGVVKSDLACVAPFYKGAVISGEIVERVSKLPVEGAIVYFEYTNTILAGRTLTATADEDGNYALPAIYVDQQSNDETVGQLYFYASGYEMSSQEVRIDEAKEITINKEMQVLNGIFDFPKAEGLEKITVDYENMYGTEYHKDIEGEVKIGAEDEEGNITSEWTIEGNTIILKYTDESPSLKEPYSEQSVFTAVAQSGKEFKEWEVKVVEPTDPENQNNNLDETDNNAAVQSGHVVKDGKYTFTPKFADTPTPGPEPKPDPTPSPTPGKDTTGSGSTKGGATGDSTLPIAGLAVGGLACAALAYVVSRKKGNNKH